MTTRKEKRKEKKEKLIERKTQKSSAYGQRETSFP